MKKKKIRSFDEEFKRAAVARLHQGEAAVRIAADLEIPRKLLYDWKRRVEQGKTINKRGRQPGANPASVTRQTDQVAYLERLVGQLTAENHFFILPCASSDRARQTRMAPKHLFPHPRTSAVP